MPQNNTNFTELYAVTYKTKVVVNFDTRVESH